MPAAFYVLLCMWFCISLLVYCYLTYWLAIQILVLWLQRQNNILERTVYFKYVSFCSYLHQKCKNAVNFSHPSQMYVTAKIFRALTGRGNIYSSPFQKSRLLLRMLPRRSLNQFLSTLLKRSERTTGYGERWLLENKNSELIWKSLNHTKKSFHMEVGAAVSIF